MTYGRRRRVGTGRTGPGAALAVGLLVAALLAPGWAVAQSFEVAAPAAILVEADTGQVLYEKNPDKETPPASLAKIMTLLLVMEALDSGRVSLDEPVVTSEYAAGMGGSQVFLAPGETHTLAEMIEAVAVASGNDAAVALAEHLFGTEAAFVEQMNLRAQELGLSGTYFADATGLPVPQEKRPGMTTPRDVASMTRALLAHPKVLEWTSVRQKVFRQQPRFVLYNTNTLLGSYPGLDGMKTGHTAEAGYHLAATAEQDGIRLVAVVMGTRSESDRNQQITQLLNYGFRAFEPAVAARQGEPVGEMRLVDGNPERFTVEAAADLRVLVPRGHQGDLRRSLELQANVKPPLKRGDTVGRVVALIQDRPVAQMPVVAARDVERAGFFARVWRRVWGGVSGAIGGAFQWIWNGIRSLLGLA
ncbi:D-alanyl-D-alanine carboxypeptidase family protein [Limnochorda pilosa]|uniref:serine-type D-Ala-D-Ala carboxypeptidase n=1 Tax=Limnochorda pilosa TaxID=1555112 RepID=A0A0K2SRE4_LIMPI|nr:D-alanyl-D-alanine carboxypeptidase family protein [Limnochorda pilosa]BAS29414.1 D-alanyl-D-alanine carboxypeptidase [Limnochorda pilosa]